MAQVKISDVFFYSVLASITHWSFRISYGTSPLFYLEGTKMEKSFLNSKLLKFLGFFIVTTA